MKPIQATPVLSGKDAEKILKQVNIPPSAKEMEKNKMLRDVLIKIRNA